jgi:hypothetical protein
VATTWSIAGEFAEACSCDFLCPCITSNLSAPATQGFCTFSMTYRIDDGRFGATRLDGVCFSIIAQSKAVMAEGSWVLGVVIDKAANDAQADALAKIAGGQAGGPIAALLPLVAEFRGIERRAISFEQNGLQRNVSISGVLEQQIDGVPSLVASGEPLAIDNSPHPANSRLALARAAKYVVSCFGLSWDNRGESRNAHFAPFNWSGAA